MLSVWFVCCSDQLFGWTREHIYMRNPKAKIMKMNTASEVFDAVQNWDKSAIEIFFACDGQLLLTQKLLDILEKLKDYEVVREVVIASKFFDLSMVKKLFEAGATEILNIDTSHIRKVADSNVEGVLVTSVDKVENENSSIDTTGREKYTSRPACFTKLIQEEILDNSENQIHQKESKEKAQSLNDSSLNMLNKDKNLASSINKTQKIKDEKEKTALCNPSSENDEKKESPSFDETSFQTGVLSNPLLPTKSNFEEEEGLPTNRFFHEEVDKSAAAPVITLVSGRGGVGKSMLAASIASLISMRGLRCALIDTDFSFGCLYRLFGIGTPIDFNLMSSKQAKFNDLVEKTSMQIAPDLTLWGPCLHPEYAELAAGCVEMLIKFLAQQADVVLIDTPSSWGEAAAASLSLCNRCLLVCDKRISDVDSLTRAIALAQALGLSRTQMTCVVNRVNSNSIDEERAVCLEMQSGIASHVRILEADSETLGLFDVGKSLDAMQRDCCYVRSIANLVDRMLKELGIVNVSNITVPNNKVSTKKIHLPWKHL